MAELGQVPVPAPVDGLWDVADYQEDGGVARASMRMDDRHREADGSVSPGALGVLVDIVLAHSCLPPDRWSLTTEMTVDVFPDLQRPGGRLHAEVRAVHADRFSGYATGTVHTTDGRLVALCSQRLRFIDTRPEPPAVGADDGGPLPGHVRDLVGGDDLVDGVVSFDVVPRVQNQLTNLHGGISMYACERAVAGLLSSSGAPTLRTTSLRVGYLRAVPAASRVSFRPTVVRAGRTLAVVDVLGAVDGAQPAIVARASAEPLV